MSAVVTNIGDLEFVWRADADGFAAGVDFKTWLANTVIQQRADLQAAQERIAEQARQLDAARVFAEYVSRRALWTESTLSHSAAIWLATNPAPEAEPQQAEKPVATDELSPCPFCGTSDALRVFEDKAEDDHDWTIAYHVECGHCGCHGRNNYPIGWCESEQAAREAWNHRGSIRPIYENPAPEAESTP